MLKTKSANLKLRFDRLKYLPGKIRYQFCIVGFKNKKSKYEICQHDDSPGFLIPEENIYFKCLELR